MMGLGYKGSHKKLMNPKHVRRLQRADEELGDLIVLGGIITFGFGTLSWFLLDDARAPLIFEAYDNRDAYMRFFFAFLNVFGFGLFLVWALGPARIWPRVALVLLSGLVGTLTVFYSVIPATGAQVLWTGIILSIYCFAILVFAIWQLARPGVSR